MNGIIHACSHINEDNCEINVTEEEIFRNIFHYIDVSLDLIIEQIFNKNKISI
jgi:5'-3' exonuclease